VSTSEQKGVVYTTASTDQGYFRVETENGIHYGEDIEFIKDVDGYLRTVHKNIGGTVNPLSGEKILGLNGAIYVGDDDFEVDSSGNVTVNGSSIDQLLVTGFSNTIGTISAGVKNYSVLTNFEAGQIEMTNDKYDVAINGQGFFDIEGPNGEVLYSRNGAFTINANSELINADGYNVMGLNGKIYIDSSDFSINEYGEIIQYDEITDKISITNFSNYGDLEKVGGSFFREISEPTGEKTELDGTVVQGAIEHSNADSITEMISLIEMNRNYESGQKVITTIDDLIGKAINEVGKV